MRALKHLHARDQVDIVHLHCPMISWNTKQFESCRENIAPVVSSLHGSWLGERDGLVAASKQKEAAVWANPNDLAILLTAKHYAGYERAAIRGSSVCVANSKATKNDFEARYSPPSDWDCEVVHWGVDTSMFVPLHRDDEDSVATHEEIRSRYGGSRLLLAVGRLAARKGYGLLLRAFANVHSSDPQIRLVIVGRGHLRSRLQRQAQALGVADAVTIESGMPFEELAALFRSADLVVYPSYYEGQGLIPLEAMASGTPVVTVDHGPLPEMVDESVGRLFVMGDPDSMAGAIMAELADPERLQEKGEAGRRRVLEKFTFEHDAVRFEDIYERAE
jgi:glycosyltransferase involved in cell wall biosynthesis